MILQSVETKVVAAAAGGGGGAAVTGFVVWLLGVAVWGAPTSADQAGAAMAAVPAPVSGLVLVVLTAAGSFISGYIAPHTQRPADPPGDGPGQHAAATN